MQNGRLFVSCALVLGACGGEPPPPAAPPPSLAASASVNPAPTTPPPPAETASARPATPSPEEAKKAEALRALHEDRAQWQEQRKLEDARWTPDLHAAAKVLADKSYPNGRAALQAAVASKTRAPGDADRDKYRHPIETLLFFGFKPTLTVVEISPGEGWYTEILAPALAHGGKLIATTQDPNGPEDQRSTFYGQRYRAFLDEAPEVYGKVQTLVVNDKSPALDLDGKADLVLLMREAHGMVNSGTLDAWLAAVRDALKPGGVLGIEEHRAKADADPLESAKSGYLPEKWLIAHVETAGFKLAGKSEVNANPKDTKDYSEGVWALPPTFRLGEKDRAKYEAIGESDRMTLKFTKVGPVR
jgi:predicted methyltransferase